MRHLTCAIAVGALVAGLTCTPLEAQGLVVVADNSTPIPNGAGNLFANFGDVAISGKNVAFNGENGFVGIRGVYGLIGGQLQVIADGTTLIPDGGSDFFTNFGAVAISGNDVVFNGENGSVGKRGIYGLIGGQLQVIADANTVIPDGGTDLFSEFGAVGISGTNVVFQGGNGSVPKAGVYGLIAGQLQVIADSNTAIPDGGTDLFDLNFAGVGISGANVVFQGGNGFVPKAGVYGRFGGPLRVIADSNTLIPDGGSDLFDLNFGAVAISGANVVFQGGNGFVPKAGVYGRLGGRLRVIADNNTVIPDGGSDLFDLGFGAVAISGANVAFQGGNGFVPKAGVYGRLGGRLRVVADSNTFIPDGGTDLFDLNFGAVAISGRDVVFQGGNGFVPKTGVYGRIGN